MGLFDRFLRAGEGKKLRALQALVSDFSALEPELERLPDDALRHKTVEFRERLDRGEHVDDLLLEAFAVVREAAKRVIGQRHYDVQLIGGAALHFGRVAEMKTGEGKTLVSTLPAYLNGLTGRGVHLVTVNDYLATRDSQWMGQIHRWLGLTVGLVVPGRIDPDFKRAQYACDITYGTNNEMGFDYLRDNMAPSLARQVQRGHAYAIVDEVDSILVDEARTPLIISGRMSGASKLYEEFARHVRPLRGFTKVKHDDEVPDWADYVVEEEKRLVTPTDKGLEAVEAKLDDVSSLFDDVRYAHALQAALRAKELFRLDKDYVVQNGEVKIVDEFTGRILEGRRWSDGLHQAVEAKEGVHIKEENQTLATVTLQNYFRMYDKLAGMTGTAMSDAAELYNTYELEVVQVPTNEPVARVDEGDLIYKGENAKFRAVIDDLAHRYETGQPVLVGTISVEKSEKLSRMLNKRGIPHEVLNAKQHFREAEIIAQAGSLHAITIATNMAGRGVDIILGGNPEGLAKRDLRAEGIGPDDEEYEPRLRELTQRYEAETASEGDKVRELGGLYVLGTERHDSRRIDNQLRGRSGRQGDPGESRFYLSLEDELMRLFATGAVSWVMDKALPEDQPLEARMVTKAIERAQNTVEQKNAITRQNVLEYDDVMNEQRKVIYLLRDQVLPVTRRGEEEPSDGALRRDHAMISDEEMRRRVVDEYLPNAVNGLVESHCVSEFSEEWDLDGLQAEARTFWPSTLSTEQFRQATSTDELYEMLMEEALTHYERREAELTPEVLREAERMLLLQLIDQRWQGHLAEMDYLREGIHLRGMATQGEKGVLREWEREGFAMFEQLMSGLKQDFVRAVMLARVEVNQPQPRERTGVEAAQNVRYSAPEDPSSSGGAAGIAAASSSGGQGQGAAGGGAATAQQVAQGNGGARGAGGPGGQPAREPEANTPVVKSEWEKTPRNAPCPCGSGKKYKQCHGR